MDRKEYLRDYYLRHKEEYRLNHENYNKAHEKELPLLGKQKRSKRAVAIKENLKNYCENNRIKMNARSAVSVAIKKGKIIKQPCVVCGSCERVDAHHEDYSKKLIVIWLCHECHCKLHAGLIKI
jgi:hypothetical protein